MKFCPAVKNSGFAQKGYFVWCGSVIKEGDTYYLFAARWPEETHFPDGYMTHSEIVLASTKDLNKPFEFRKVVLTGSGCEGDWDRQMVHNPFVFRLDDRYVLFYIANSDGKSATRAIGYAVSERLDGEWTRMKKPVALPPDANNPAVLVEDGRILLYYRDGQLKVSVAAANSLDDDFAVIGFDLFPKGMIEDMFVYKIGEAYHMVAEDAGGAYTGNAKAGVSFVSADGVNWSEGKMPAAYGYEVEYDDGSRVILQRRERPMILFDGKEKYLFTTAKTGGETQLTGGSTWNMVQKIDDLEI